MFYVVVTEQDEMDIYIKFLYLSRSQDTLPYNKAFDGRHVKARGVSRR